VSVRVIVAFASEADGRAIGCVIVGERIVTRLVFFFFDFDFDRLHQDRLRAIPATDALAREVIGDSVLFPATGAFDGQNRLLYKTSRQGEEQLAVLNVTPIMQAIQMFLLRCRRRIMMCGN
jgi:hypothetical protein